MSNLRKNPNCDGVFCTNKEGEVRLLPCMKPVAGSRKIAVEKGTTRLCLSCFLKQMIYRKGLNKTLRGMYVTNEKAYFDTPGWDELEVYKP